MSIFSEVKEHLTARQAAEGYGLQIKGSCMACCPFHDDKHPSMKIDKNYYCFACGVGGDAIDYVSRMFGLTQYEAALKLIEDFALPVDVKENARFNVQEKEQIQKKKAEKERIIRIQERFQMWCNRTTELLKDALIRIQETGVFLMGKPPDAVFCEEYAQMLHAELLINYWLDILCMGETAEKQEVFIKDRREVEHLAEKVRATRERIVERNRGSA